MKRDAYRPWWLLAVVLVVSTVFYGVGIWFGIPSGETRDGYQAIQDRDAGLTLVPVAARDIEAGEMISWRELNWVYIPPDYIHYAVLLAEMSISGQQVTTPVYADEFFRNERFMTDEARKAQSAPPAPSPSDPPAP